MSLQAAKCFAACEEGRDWVFKEAISRPRCHRHVIHWFLTRGESLVVCVNVDYLGLPTF